MYLCQDKPVNLWHFLQHLMTCLEEMHELHNHASQVVSCVHPVG